MAEVERMASWNYAGLIILGQTAAFFSLLQFEGATEAFCHGARFCDAEPCAYGQ